MPPKNNKRASVVERKAVKFLITDRPHPDTVEMYLKDLQAHAVSHLVRVCEPSYDTALLAAASIETHDWAYPDGDNPSTEIITNWLTLCMATFHTNAVKGEQTAIAVHCVAGLGRAPVMVALALIESGMSAEDAVLFIRERRKGAVNSKQLEFLQSYKPTKAFSVRKGSGKGKWWPW